MKYFLVATGDPFEKKLVASEIYHLQLSLLLGKQTRRSLPAHAVHLQCKLKSTWPKLSRSMAAYPKKLYDNDVKTNISSQFFGVWAVKRYVYSS